MRGATTSPILVIEDDASVARLLALHLRRAGFLVETADSLGRAREQAWRVRWDVALLDRNLPDGSSLELCAALRAAVPHAYIIMLSGDASEESVEEGLACGADDYVFKPFAAHDLLARVRAGLRIVELQKKVSELSRQPSAAARPADLRS